MSILPLPTTQCTMIPDASWMRAINKIVMDADECKSCRSETQMFLKDKESFLIVKIQIIPRLSPGRNSRPTPGVTPGPIFRPALASASPSASPLAQPFASPPCNAPMDANAKDDDAKSSKSSSSVFKLNYLFSKFCAKMKMGQPTG